MSTQIPTIEESNKFNLVTSIWIVPFIALFIAGWLAYQYYSELGPEIKIIFPQNEGLQAGQSVIKYKNVIIGKVTKLELENDGSNVAVYARMDKSAKPFLNEFTKFWIVKPEVGIGGITGLDTLISGTYIDTSSETGGEFRTTFTGMSNYNTMNMEGEYFHLNASTAYNIQSGTPIFFKNIKVGTVEYVTISVDGQSIDFFAFIEKPYNDYVHTDSKFWIRSAIDVDYSSGRLDVNIAPITHLIQGGISFSSSGEDANKKVPSRHVFHLFKNEGTVEGKKIGKGGDAYKGFEVHLFDSVANLNSDASVKYDGYDVGRVNDMDVVYDPLTHKMAAKVYLKIDTSFFDSGKESNATGEKNFIKAIEEGLYAQVAQTDPITGVLYVNLVFNKESALPVHVVQGEKYPVIPSRSNADNNLIVQLGTLLATTNKIVDENAKPLHETIVSLSETMKNVNAMMAQKEVQTIPKELDQSLKHLTKMLKGYESNSLRGDQLAQTLKAVQETSNEMKAFLKVLNRKPEAMVFGEE